METVKLIMTIVQVLVSLALIISVIFQSGKHAGMSGSIDGVADTFFGKNKARSLDAKLEKLTGVLAIAFIVLTFVITLLVDGLPAYLYSKGLYSSEKLSGGSPAPITSFEEGKIYRMSAKGEVEKDGSIPIDEDDIDPMDRCLEITVDVVDWAIELVYPEF